MKDRDLTEREKLVLRYIIQNFILTVHPIGSRHLKKVYNIDLSPATIRNVMQDLEELGYIEQPYASAGRVPTDKGYRIYVNQLMKIQKLTKREKKLISENVANFSPTSKELFDNIAEILGKITNQLSFIMKPQLKYGILEKVEIIPISSGKILVILNIESEIAKTIMMELDSEIKDKDIELTTAILNERIAGLKLEKIRNTFSQRMKDISMVNQGLIRLFLNSIDKVFTLNEEGDIRFSTTKEIIKQPEFSDSKNIKAIIEMIEDKKVVIHLISKRETEKGISITIGSENEEEIVKNFTIITSNYYSGNMKGTLGIIGPTRMKYPKIISFIDYTSNLLSEFL